ncbi:hypothetical protein ACIA7S_28550 [Streptomyces sp. NPDC051643]|uniref:hypothetical protein n=1 Tax=Streptomyces sp. NPDC051643 TaxID=3365665 RepID=UPI0037894987
MQTTMRRPQAAPVIPRCPVGVLDRHCPRTAGFGTDHPGTGQCRQHELEAAAAARREALGPVPPMVFREPAYVDGLSYQATASGPGVETDDEGDEWDVAA